MIINKPLIYLLSLFTALNSYGQTLPDSVKGNVPFRYAVGINLFPALVYLEPNFDLEIKAANNISVKLGYGYRFNGIFLIQRTLEKKDKVL